jgi:hypothetical protein
MTEQEFMDMYLDNHCLEDFEGALEFLTNQIDDEFKKKYSINDIILTIIETLRYNEYPEELYSMWLLIKEKYPDIYPENFEKIDFKIIEYLLCEKKFDEIEAPLENIINYPTKDLIGTIVCYNHLMCYHQTELFDKVITRNYEELADHENTTPMLAENFAVTKLMLLIQEMYENKDLDRKRLSDELAIYDFEFTDKIFEKFEYEWFKPVLSEDELKQVFKEHDGQRHHILNSYFQRYMHERGFDFYLPYHLTYFFDIYFQDIHYDYDDFNEYYNAESDLFSDFLVNLYYSVDKRSSSRVFFVLWGLVYFYDFLLESGYISKSVYDNAQKIILEEKAWAILKYHNMLWKNSFVHHWQKPDSINEEEFINEKYLFLNTMGILNLPIQDFMQINEEELKEMGKLYDRILYMANNYQFYDDDEYDDDDDDDEDFYDDDDDEDFYDDDEDYDDRRNPGTYVREEKIGRNEPCPCGNGRKHKNCCGKN